MKLTEAEWFAAKVRPQLNDIIVRVAIRQFLKNFTRDYEAAIRRRAALEQEGK